MGPLCDIKLPGVELQGPMHNRNPGYILFMLTYYCAPPWTNCLSIYFSGGIADGAFGSLDATSYSSGTPIINSLEYYRFQSIWCTDFMESVEAVCD